jgi:hypothetical protein
MVSVLAGRGLALSGDWGNPRYVIRSCLRFLTAILGHDRARCAAVSTMSHETHLSDQELLMLADGELSARESAQADSHLATCWACRARKQELESTIAEFIRFHRASYDHKIPGADGPAALLKARLREQAHRNCWSDFLCSFGKKLARPLVAALLACVAIPLVWERVVNRHSATPVIVTVPNPTITPGATLVLSQPDVCRATTAKNKMVPVALRKRVFAEYGIQAAQLEAYEIDYLITPALGGADDIHNLWPESNESAVWNARVKDELEDRLREMVCEGQLDLQVAQRDIASNWIEAYKKYFHTDRPTMNLR